MALLEREEPLACLAGYAAEARAGAGRLVLIAGEAGVGKSALVGQFTAGLGKLGVPDRRAAAAQAARLGLACDVAENPASNQLRGPAFRRGVSALGVRDDPDGRGGTPGCEPG